MKLEAYAKVNLCLEVLGRRTDGFHELRTVFQTIALADTLEVDFTPGRRTDVVLESDVDIPNNLVVRAAQAVLDATRARGVARFRLTKRIPMGGGLGGGSSDAAAVLRSLPALTGKPIPMDKLLSIGAALGSDVPFFLVGGTAVGLGRGTELYPLPPLRAKHVLLVTPGIHVSTPEAYRALDRPALAGVPIAGKTQQMAMNLSDWTRFAVNDFEPVVFAQHPELKRLKAKLKRLGAKLALMSGSGSTLFGVFDSAEELQRAAIAFGTVPVVSTSFLAKAI